MSYTLLHDPNNADSVAFLAIFGASGQVISDPASWQGVIPNFQGVPTVVYEDVRGQRHAMFNPKTMDAVTAWRDAIDNPPPNTLVTPYNFVSRFTLEEDAAIRQAMASNYLLQAFWGRVQIATGGIGLKDPDTIAGLGLLVSIGIFTQARADMILTP